MERVHSFGLAFLLINKNKLLIKKRKENIMFGSTVTNYFGETKYKVGDELRNEFEPKCYIYKVVAILQESNPFETLIWYNIDKYRKGEKIEEMSGLQEVVESSELFKKI